ncbi:hypothetical protein EV177_010966, partial [Coemansia sp. RSA 1804]
VSGGTAVSTSGTADAGRNIRHEAAGQSYRGGISTSTTNSRRMVGPYQLAKTIGAGSMGKVKVALDTRTNKR